MDLRRCATVEFFSDDESTFMNLDELTSLASSDNKFKALSVGLAVVIAVIMTVFFLKPTENGNGEIIINSCDPLPGVGVPSDDRSADNILVAEISGAVKEPGVYELESGSRLVDLLGKSGGAVSDASAAWLAQNINLASFLTDSQKIYIPFEWDLKIGNMPEVSPYIAVKNSVPNAISSTIPASSAVVSSTAGEKIDVNSADTDQLQALPGIGATYAQRIIEARPFTDLTDLQERAKIPVSTMDKIKNLVKLN